MRLRSLRDSGHLAGYLKDVGQQAEGRYLELMEPAMLETANMQDSQEMARILETARLTAEADVMRELVLVPDPDTERAMKEGGYR